jgi:hypothetical protein
LASTVTLDKGSGPVQVTANDGKDWLFLPGSPVENVPAEVVKVLDDEKAKYETGKGKE